MQNLQPKNFDLEKLEEFMYGHIRALPEEYANFTSLVLLLSTLNKSELQGAFYGEGTNC